MYIVSIVLFKVHLFVRTKTTICCFGEKKNSDSLSQSLLFKSGYETRSHKDTLMNSYKCRDIFPGILDVRRENLYNI